MTSRCLQCAPISFQLKSRRRHREAEADGVVGEAAGDAGLALGRRKINSRNSPPPVNPRPDSNLHGFC